MAKNKKMNKADRYIASLNDIDDKTVIITGANSGLGYEIARVALLKHAHVVMACRNLSRAESAKERLILDTGFNNVDIEQFDQSDIKGIKGFAERIIEKYPHFYALVLNAGIFLPSEVVDEYHISNVYRTNFLGAYKLVSCLKDFLDNSSEERRIIIQGSVASFRYKYKNKKNNFIYGEVAPLKQYALSKLCVSNVYVYFRDNNQNPYVKYLLCEPGVALTNLFHNFKEWFKKIAFIYLKYFTNSAREGSLSACKLMCDIAANGDYCRPRGFFTAVGLPTKAKYTKKAIFQEIITDAEEVLKNYEPNQE